MGESPFGIKFYNEFFMFREFEPIDIIILEAKQHFDGLSLPLVVSDLPGKLTHLYDINSVNTVATKTTLEMASIDI